MVKVEYENGKRLIVYGHAQYAPFGEDIVCAGVSALYQVLVMSLYRLTNSKVRHYMMDNKYYIDFHEELGERAQVLIDSFLLGITELEKEYPKHVKLTKH